MDRLISERWANRAKVWKQRHLSGWRVGASLFSVAALLVFLANIGITIYSVKRYGGTVAGGFKPIFIGDCYQSKKLNSLIHLTVNILSSILLSGSNFSMQVLTAPTRKQIDNAHAKKEWLDIGIPSIRNLRTMGKGRRVLWALILITSTPLHLIYNSAYSRSSTRQAYEAALVTEDFLNGALFDAGYTDPHPNNPDQRRLFGEIQRNASTYERLDVMSCIRAYNKKAVTDRKTLLVVTSSPRPNINVEYSLWPPALLKDGTPNSIYATEDFVGNEVGDGTWGWMCPSNTGSAARECDLTKVLNGLEDWSPFFPGIKVDYCLSEYLGEQCTLDFSFGLMAAVCVSNLVNLICMTILCFFKSNTPLLSIGDAVSSFLDTPDSTTTGTGLVGKEAIEVLWNDSRVIPASTSVIGHIQPQRWFKASSRRRWVSFTLLSASSILLVAVLLALGLKNPRAIGSYRGLWQLSFGASSIDDPSPYAITYGHGLYQPKRLVENMLLANLPQLVISFIFLVYNSILTAMLMAKEWSEFAHDRKTLRVTAPSGKQRSTYYLQLPYRYSLPLLATSTLLHWLAAKAIFLDRRIVLSVWWNEPYTDNQIGSISTLSYSPLAVMFCLIVGIIMVFALVVLGFRRYKPGIPLVGSCSAAISAACHASNCETDTSVLPLRWGIILEERKNSVDHYGFSSSEASVQQSRYRYAGSKIKDERLSRF